MSLEELEIEIERGLERWPDAKTSICPMNGERYETVSLGYVLNGTSKEGHVVEMMAQMLNQFKEKRKAKYISWRKHFEWFEEPLIPERLFTDENHYSNVPAMVNDRRRCLRARILITANANDPEWAEKEI